MILEMVTSTSRLVVEFDIDDVMSVEIGDIDDANHVESCERADSGKLTWRRTSFARLAHQGIAFLPSFELIQVGRQVGLS